MTDGEVIAKSERTSARCARYFFQAAERPRETKSDHRAAPSRQGEKHWRRWCRPTPREMPLGGGRHDKTGENSTPTIGEDSTPAHKPSRPSPSGLPAI